MIITDGSRTHVGSRVDNADARLYANGVAEIRQRIDIARDTVARVREKKEQDLVSVETIFLQMRKTHFLSRAALLRSFWNFPMPRWAPTTLITIGNTIHVYWVERPWW